MSILFFTFSQSGLLMSVIRTLSASESNEQRDREKARLEREYRKSDQRLDQLITNHDQALKDVMQVCMWVFLPSYIFASLCEFISLVGVFMS